MKSALKALYQFSHSCKGNAKLLESNQFWLTGTVNALDRTYYLKRHHIDFHIQSIISKVISWNEMSKIQINILFSYKNYIYCMYNIKLESIYIKLHYI